ncbi:MAG TPA: hypothetical protein VGO45_07770 [Bacteroidia bacterium]|jgi:hypothetical protein|nr:hypothetical protein [Bacteroidia bacterium]
MSKYKCRKDADGHNSWILSNEIGPFAKITVHQNRSATVTASDEFETLSIHIPAKEVPCIIHNGKTSKTQVEVLERRLKGKRWEMSIPYILN